MLQKGNIMKKIQIQKQQNLTFLEACTEYIFNCKLRNLRNGTIRHYEQTIKSLCKYIPPQTDVGILT